MSSEDTPVDVPVGDVPSQGLVLGSKTYDRAQFLVRVVLPALAVFYAALAGFWGFPAVEGVVGTITAVALLLGTILRQSSKAFAETHVTAKLSGDFVVTDDPETTSMVTQLRLNDEPHNITKGDVLAFRVKRE